MYQLDLLAQPKPRIAVQLRDYQIALKREIYQRIKEGYKRILVYSPTGSGKTLVLSSILRDALSRQRRSTLLIHRDFLVDQTTETLLNLEVPQYEIGVIKAGYQEERSKLIQIAGIQSLMRREIPPADLVIADECHTVAYWNDYKRIKKVNSEAIFLGFTASPWRTNKSEYFGQHYDVIVRGPSIRWLTDHGYLSPARYFGWGGIVDISKLETGKDGDFKTKQMEAVYLNEKVPEAVTERILEYCEGRTGIVFNAGVMQSIKQTELLNKAGVPTVHIDADTSPQERKQAYQDLESGVIRCISSIGCLTEGFDVKSISFIAFARATKSQALYVQICGRGIRSSPGKENCLILDFGDNWRRLGFLTKDWEITLDPVIKKKERTLLKECPSCHAAVSIFSRICPECGYVFEPDSNDGTGGDLPEDEDFEKEFGEIFDEETMELVKYVRAQRKSRFTKHLAPDALWATFKEKFGMQTILINDWLYGATFAGKKNQYYQQQYLKYLEQFKPKGKNDINAQMWIKFHMDLEFKKPGKNQDKEQPIYHKLRWWEVFGCSPYTDFDTAKRIYQNAIKQLNQQFDNDTITRIRLLNMALEDAIRSTNNIEGFLGF